MKKSITFFAAAIALTAAFAGPASAEISRSELTKNIKSAGLGGGTRIRTRISGDTVTISGYYENSLDQSLAEQAAKRTAGVECVVNLAFPRN